MQNVNVDTILYNLSFGAEKEESINHVYYAQVQYVFLENFMKLEL